MRLPVAHAADHGTEGRAVAVAERRLSAKYRDFEVLTDISLTVGRGRRWRWSGESGSGKSTLGRLIVGLKEPAAGNGQLRRQAALPASGASPLGWRRLKRIQIIYQSADTALNPRQTVRKIVGRPLTLYHGLRGAKREARLIELLKMVELDAGYADRTPGQLSGGQKQRVAIARALAANPELIVCDEITSALDKVVQAEVLRMLMKLKAELGVSYLFITHDIEVVRAIADRVVVMQHGRIVEQGTRDEVFSPPHQPYTETLLASVPAMATGWLDDLIATRAALTRSSARSRPRAPDV
jgi:peptide/nickel transport system ATP-binding protein